MLEHFQCGVGVYVCVCEGGVGGITLYKCFASFLKYISWTEQP